MSIHPEERMETCTPPAVTASGHPRVTQSTRAVLERSEEGGSQGRLDLVRAHGFPQHSGFMTLATSNRTLDLLKT